MSNAAVQIQNLLYRYAEHVDAANFGAAADLFNDAEVVVRGTSGQGPALVRAFWDNHLKIHGDGTPRTRHICANPIIEFGADEKSADVRTIYIVLQATEALPLQVISVGRYFDRFVEEDGRWRFARRDFGGADLLGNISELIRS